MTDIIDEIEDRLTRLEEGAGNYYKPLTVAADEYIWFSENPQERVYFGIEDFDRKMRGIAPGELCLIVGFAHSGKTVLATEFLINNHELPLVMWTPDETRTGLLAKLASARTGIGAEELERRLYHRDPEARKMLLEVASFHQKLVVYDKQPTLHQMGVMYDEACEALGEPPKAFVFDYAEQLREDTDTKTKLDLLKSFGKENNCAAVVLHQASRYKGAGGRELGLDAGAYGGDGQATFILTVRRKRTFFNEQLRDLREKIDMATNPKSIERYEEKMYDIIHDQIPRHKNTVSVGLPKNKRPPMHPLDEIDFHMDADTGRISKMGGDNTPPPEHEQSEMTVNDGGGNPHALLKG